MAVANPQKQLKELTQDDQTVSLHTITPNPEETILYIARVSSNVVESTRERDKKLIAHFLRNNEWSPFEHAYMTLSIKTSRAMSAQLIRHRSFTFQEFCVDKDTLVLTNDGYKTIDSLDIEEDKVICVKNLQNGKNQDNLKNAASKDLNPHNKMEFPKDLNPHDGLGFYKDLKDIELVPCEFALCDAGKKNMYEVRFTNTKNTITCTEEHMFLLEDGSYVPLKLILERDQELKKSNLCEPTKMLFIDVPAEHLSKETINDDVSKNSILVSIESVRFVGERDALDICMLGPIKNYVANGFIVHNSQRYASPDGIYIYEARDQDMKNRQNSLTTTSEENKSWFDKVQRDHAQQAYKLYNEAIQRGIAKECARFLLPMSTATTIHMTGNLRSWMTYFLTRLREFDKNKQDDVHKEHGADGPAQTEHFDIAVKCKKIFDEQCPLIAECMREM
jgi:thymidylate synthase ThyX